MMSNLHHKSFVGDVEKVGRVLTDSRSSQLTSVDTRSDLAVSRRRPTFQRHQRVETASRRSVLSCESNQPMNVDQISATTPLIATQDDTDRNEATFPFASSSLEPETSRSLCSESCDLCTSGFKRVRRSRAQRWKPQCDSQLQRMLNSKIWSQVHNESWDLPKSKKMETGSPSLSEKNYKSRFVQ